MMSKQTRSGWIAILVVVAMGSVPGTARAQYGGFGGGFGFGGMGWGFGMFNPAPSPTNFINQKALVNAGRPPQLPSRTPYANNPNSYINSIRDNGFVSRYDVDRRQPMGYRGGGSSGPESSRPSPARSVAEPPARPVRPLANFYSADHHLIWPADAPVGDLKAKRSAADTAAGVVFSETRQSGVASMASVTDARQKLIDYGRPALDEIRNRDSAAVADLFHAYLLSLYDSLALAATPGLAAAK